MIDEAPRAGDTLGEYVLTHLLGRGASGLVFRAERRGSAEPVAIKILDLAPGSLGVTRARFEKEAHLLMRIDHPHVVKVRDARVEGTRPYLAMDLLSGPSLATRLREGPLAPGALAASGAELLSALAAIHRTGILHRDLTPANLIFDSGRLVVVDFGLSRLVDEETVTRNRGIHLALGYCPPERLQGGALTQAADIYQAGLVLFEMATGRRVFPGEGAAEILQAHASLSPPRASGLNPALPPLIDRVLDKALRKAPADRYADAAALEEDWRFIFARA